MRAGAVGVCYPYSTSPISNVSASYPCEPPHPCKNEGSVKVPGFDQEGSLASSNWRQMHKCKMLYKHTGESETWKLCCENLEKSNIESKLYLFLKQWVALKNKCLHTPICIPDGLIK